MYCPESVVNFIDGNNSPFSQRPILHSNSDLSEFIGYLAHHDEQRLQNLVDGKSISFYLSEYILFVNVSFRTSDLIWSILLQKGYLAIDWDKTDSIDGGYNCRIYARLPNLEMKKCFTDNIKFEPL